ncbi:phospholipase C/P1 nuclease domain-containing protein [Irpex rosettiformis]|uniref:Phospholipase C/P1 nuclease domain-containing protein n=1 Tax=Irpex rosettiformis TaxID=378272 RepID=A0ACB8TRL8_9APHY|nr:phospholipase C/P1 nuclease domain-containing protein [Irpex rosettiformis]
MKQSILWTFAALASAPNVYAWGAAGHEIVATIAQIYLHPSTLNTVCEILDPGSSLRASPTSTPCYISRIASWADKVRRQPKYRYTASLHYVGAVDDHPSQTCAFPGARGWNGKQDQNVLGAVRNTTETLVEYLDGGHGRDTAEEALKFLVHYVGDMHMPLHLTGRERGGNGVKVTFDGRVTNLHSLWDSLLIASSLRTLPYNYTRPFPKGSTRLDVESHLRGAIYDPYVRRVLYEGLGIGPEEGRFTNDMNDWLLCPVPTSQPPSLWNSLQTVLGLSRVGDETRWDDDVLCPYAWGKQLHQLNCAFPVWPAELDLPPYNTSHVHSRSNEFEHVHDEENFKEFLSRPPRPHPDLLELDTPEYAGRLRNEWVVERLMAMAGVRLAGLLNGLFMDTQGLEGEYGSLPLILV